ncbi:hypothetical protein [Acinetobacter sp. WZC-1]|uniref:hypothetical protein n=1 Tax=Acinetobacter sp. WZC-1 TaxID=3459034 RepID=UPI00403D7C3A
MRLSRVQDTGSSPIFIPNGFDIYFNEFNNNFKNDRDVLRRLIDDYGSLGYKLERETVIPPFLIELMGRKSKAPVIV